MKRHNLSALVQAASKQGFTVHLSFDSGRPVFAVGCAEYGGDREFETYTEALAWVELRSQTPQSKVGADITRLLATLPGGAQ